MELQLENMRMDNEIKALEIASQRRRLSGQIGPGMPDSVQVNPAQVTSSVKGRPNVEAGHVPSVGYARAGNGGLTPVPSKDIKERIEDQLVPETVWAGQNYIAPMFQDNPPNKPPRKYLPKGYKDWQWSIKDATWYPIKKKGRSAWGRWSDWVTGWQK